MVVRLGAAICGAAILFCSSAARAESGIASVYAYAGEKTASGERANPGGLTAAHRTLAFGTHVRVTNLDNGREATLVIVGRGPFIHSRIIDVSTSAAEVLGFRQSGVARVKIEVVD